jgi:hypothetical protein
MLVFLFISCQVQVGKSEPTQFSEESLVMNLKIDISENGSASVSCSIIGSASHPVNLSIPKTVEEYSCNSLVKSLSFLDGFDYNSLQIEPSTDGILDIEVSYSWPDCAVPFNDSYYVGSNELLPMYPTGVDIQSNITIIFPPNATIVRCDVSETKNETVYDRLHISFTKNGYHYIAHDEFLPCIIFKQTLFRDSTANLQGVRIDLAYPIALSRWASKFYSYSNRAYDELDSMWGSRTTRKPLRINIVPWATIVDATAYYSQNEDAIYFPANWIFGISYSLSRPVHVLFHEIVHAFSDFNLPHFMSEGLAEYVAFELSAMLQLEKDTKEANFKNPIEDPEFNSTEFFDWYSETASYPQFTFVVYGMINFTGPKSFKNFMSLLREKNIDFAGYSQQDRYELLVYYINSQSGKNIAGLFSKYGLEIDVNRLSQRAFISRIVVGSGTFIFLVFSCVALMFLLRKRMRILLLHLAVLSALAIFTLIISTLPVESFLSELAVSIICVSLMILTAACCLLLRYTKSSFVQTIRKSDELGSPVDSN